MQQYTPHELEMLHPATATLLNERGYIYQREVKMPEYGRADFVVYDGETVRYVVECKWDAGRNLGRYVAQVRDYVRQVGGIAVIALPNRVIDERALDICAYYGVECWAVNIDDYLTLYDYIQHQEAQIQYKMEIARAVHPKTQEVLFADCCRIFAIRVLPSVRLIYGNDLHVTRMLRKAVVTSYLYPSIGSEYELVDSFHSELVEANKQTERNLRTLCDQLMRVAYTHYAVGGFDLDEISISECADAVREWLRTEPKMNEAFAIIVDGLLAVEKALTPYMK